jgi:predicted acylesterase/phospholipase RssA
MPDTATALVLSAGGMFGAWQAGAWRALAGRFRPSLVAGASVGALNAWAIAGGIDPEDLAALWLAPDSARLARLRPRPWSLFDARPLHERIRRLHAAFRPRVDIGIVAVALPALRPRLFVNREITWEHLAASCAVLLCYPQVRLAGGWHTDGGLLGAVPLWAAPRMGAAAALVLNALPRAPSLAVRAAVRAIRAAAPRPPSPPPGFPVRLLEPSRPLGSFRSAVFWDPAAVERWLRQGQADAAQLQCP